MTYLHDSKDNKKTLLIYFLCLIPLVIYGIYKNGYLLYINKYISFISIFKPLILIFIAVILTLLVDFLFDKKIEINYNLLNSIIISLFCPCNINYLVFIIVLFIYLLINKLFLKNISFNKICLVHLILVFIMFLLNKYSYLNLGEVNNIYLYNISDIILGRGIGAISTTSIILGLIIYSILCFLTNYKKIIPLISYLVYLITIILIMFIQKNINYELIFSSNIILGFILVSTDTLTTPYYLKGEVIYAIFIGMFCALISIKLPFEGIFIATLIGSLITFLFNKIGKYLEK